MFLGAMSILIFLITFPQIKVLYTLALNSDETRTQLGRNSDATRTQLGRNSDATRTQLGRNSDETDYTYFVVWKSRHVMKFNKVNVLNILM